MFVTLNKISLTGIHLNVNNYNEINALRKKKCYSCQGNFLS